MKISFLKPKQKGKYFLALDIGTETVKAVVFKKENQKPVILGGAMKHYEQFGVFNSRDFSQDVFKKAISQSITEAQKQAKVETKFTILTLPSDVFKARIVFHSFNRKKPKVIINKQEEKDILENALKEARQEITRTYAQKSGILPGELEFLNLEILGIKVDGYQVPCLRGYEGGKLEFRILTTFALKNYFQNFIKIIENLGLKILKTVHPAQNLLDSFGEDNAILVDVGGELTQIFFIKDGKMERIDEFDMGGIAFTQALSRALGLSEVRARILKERYSQGILEEGTRKKIHEIFSDTIQDWFDNLKSKLTAFEGLFSSTIFLFGGGSQLPEIQQILEEENWRVKFIYPKDLKSLLDDNKVISLEDKTHILNSPKDINLLLLCYGE